MNLIAIVIFAGAIAAAYLGRRLTVSRGPVRLPEETVLPEPIARAVERSNPITRRLRFVIAMELSGIESAFVSDRTLYDKTAGAARASLANVRRACPLVVPRLESDTPVIRVDRRPPGFIATVEWRTRAVQITETFKSCVEQSLRRGSDGERIRRLTVSLV